MFQLLRPFSRSGAGAVLCDDAHHATLARAPRTQAVAELNEVDMVDKNAALYRQIIISRGTQGARY